MKMTSDRVSFNKGLVWGCLWGGLTVIIIWLCFSSPSSEASVAQSRAGFFENNGPKRQSTETSSTEVLCREWVGNDKVGKQQSRPTFYKVSAYCPCPACCNKWSDGVTASGHIIKEDDAFVAAPLSFPFGTVLDIPYYGKVPVLDRGGAIKGNRLDVFFSTHQKALNWGVKYLNVRF